VWPGLACCVCCSALHTDACLAVAVGCCWCVCGRSLDLPAPWGSSRTGLCKHGLEPCWCLAHVVHCMCCDPLGRQQQHWWLTASPAPTVPLPRRSLYNNNLTGGLPAEYSVLSKLVTMWAAQPGSGAGTEWQR
jgi:hypothetical protein